MRAGLERLGPRGKRAAPALVVPSSSSSLPPPPSPLPRPASAADDEYWSEDEAEEVQSPIDAVDPFVAFAGAGGARACLGRREGALALPV